MLVCVLFMISNAQLILNKYRTLLISVTQKPLLIGRLKWASGLLFLSHPLLFLGATGWHH